MHIHKGTEFIIPNNSTIAFKDNGKIIVNGNLKVLGTSENPTSFISEDQFDKARIVVNHGEIKLNHVHFYANQNNNGWIKADHSNLSISHCNINAENDKLLAINRSDIILNENLIFGGDSGIVIKHSNGDFYGNTFIKNQTGIYLEASAVIGHHNSFQENKVSISLEENSWYDSKKTIITESDTGLQVKNNSKAWINRLELNQIDLGFMVSSSEEARPSRVDIIKCERNDVKEDYQIDELSFLHLKSFLIHHH